VCSSVVCKTYFIEHFPLFASLFLIIKASRCIHFSNLLLEWNSTCFGQSLCPSSGVFHCTHSNGICHTGLLTACKQAVSKPLWHIPLLCVQWKTPDAGQRDCPKHVEFHSKNKFEKWMHLVGFVVRNLSCCTVTWMSNLLHCVLAHEFKHWAEVAYLHWAVWWLLIIL
jgi:hypothetical protein